METSTNWSFSPVSEEERRRFLASLQDRDNRLLIPTVVFLSCVALVGVCGNSVVVLVYSKKGRKSATDVFITAIAAFDLLTNVLGIPNEIYDTFHYWDFDTIAQCELRVYVNAFTTMTSALSLLAVAFTRYKKICKPFGRQTSVRHARIYTVGIALTCALFAIPQPILYGIHTRPTSRGDIVGKACDIDDSYVDTFWPILFTGFLMFLFVATYIPLIVLYVLVGIQAWKHSRVHGVPVVSDIPTTASDGTVSGDLDLDSEVDLDSRSKSKSKGNNCIPLSFFKRRNKNVSGNSNNNNNSNIHVERYQLKTFSGVDEETPIPATTTTAAAAASTAGDQGHKDANNDASGDSDRHVKFNEITEDTIQPKEEDDKHETPITNHKARPSRSKKNKTRRVLNRTTLMLIIITAVYVIAFVPYLILAALKFASSSFYDSLDPAGESAYNVFLRFFFINSAANAIVYSLLDRRFREDVGNIFKCK